METPWRIERHPSGVVLVYGNTGGVREATLAEAWAADRITELESLLHRIDAVIAWETTPLGRAFQHEMEAALRRKS